MCNPANSDWECCTSANKCDVGQGDCDNDSHCSGNLVCGSNNCADGESGLDCCENPPRDCNPANSDFECCTSTDKCNLGEGDCDSDSHCAGNLVCGTNNCATGDSTLDCCENPPRDCNPANSDFECCTSQDKCNLGEGDCDNDSHCAGSLVCGYNNCAAGDSSMDCCIRNCNPANSDFECCTDTYKCGLGQGDCDNDSHCAGNLVCGTNNCAAGDSTMDCCVRP